MQEGFLKLRKEAFLKFKDFLKSNILKSRIPNKNNRNFKNDYRLAFKLRFSFQDYLIKEVK